jgi:hypothetical protein
MKRFFLLIVTLAFTTLLAEAQWSPSGSNIYYNNGNVGIGITSPGARLQVYTNGSTESNFPSGNSYGNIDFFLRHHNQGIEFGTGAKMNERKSWILARHSDVVNYGTYFSTLHLQPLIDGVPDSRYRGVAIKKSPNLHIPVGRALWVGGPSVFDESLAIGTSDPKGYKLAVAGKVIAEEVVVKLQVQWPDYVFLPTYNLRPLKEIEAHIQTHGHLPEVPNTKMVEKSGIGLGEMNILLLKKVEELTLYSIEQERNLERQNEIVEQQGEAIEELKRQKKVLETQVNRIDELEKLIINRLDQ